MGAAAAAGVGNLMVGAAVGFGGRFIRTVSFLGCTFAASVGRGGTAPVGKLGKFSAIYFLTTLESAPSAVKLLFRLHKPKPSDTD